MRLYTVGKALCGIFFRAALRVEVEGKENLPAEGPVLICSNHVSNFDPPLVGTFIKRDVVFMAKEELVTNRFAGPIISRLEVMPVKRGMADRQALKQGLQLLKDGKVLCLFPEGTRSKTGAIGEGLSGAGFFALRSSAVVVPVAITGEFKPLGKVKISYGAPVNMSKLRKEKANAETATKVIMKRIKELKESQILLK
ncbi:1-acyl-sn-glycerol-3-phosphate acyltransferase [Sinobaca sp. H24]|uniref:lysophospholipid acyltransferase family protein n=1 Tax=Sinobaca sp. H24 TaxID=2923376 RepID=UPI00207AD1FB|nr:lysophospholipid acyltransferase family protein [Sinobaca sp. H24]